MRLLLPLVLTALAFATGASAAPTSRGAPFQPRFEPGPCAVDLAATGRRFDCGMLVVEETRGSGDGRRVALPVAILRAAHSNGQPPVIYLHGGPGGGAVGHLAPSPGRNARRANWLGEDQDVVYFDQRGGGLAVPTLDCGQLALDDAGPDSDATVASLTACADRLRASGVNLSRYNASETAKDVQDLRRTLKLSAVDLFGGSYGTRIALEVVRDQPAGVRAVVLDSFWPPEAKWVENAALPVARAVRMILQLCTTDPTCTVADKATLEPRMDAMVREWLVAPKGPKDGSRLYPVDDFAQYLMDAAYSGPDARALPSVFSKLLAGDFQPLADYTRNRSGYAEAQHLTFICQDHIAFEDRAKTLAQAGEDPYAQALVRTLVRDMDACAAFKLGPPVPGDNRPVVSSLPILILNAGIDPGCPPELAQAAVKRFSKGQLVIFPYLTHGVTRNPCAASMAKAFLRDPNQAHRSDLLGGRAIGLPLHRIVGRHKDSAGRPPRGPSPCELRRNAPHERLDLFLTA